MAALNARTGWVFTGLDSVSDDIVVIGRARPRPPMKVKTAQNHNISELLSTFPELDGCMYPTDVGVGEQRRALLYQLSVRRDRHARLDPVPDSVWLTAIDRLVRRLPFLHGDSPVDLESWQARAYCLVGEITPRSIPGLPLSLVGSTNRDVMRVDPLLISQETADYMARVDSVDLEWIRGASIGELADAGLLLVCTALIKNEAMDRQKYLQRAARLLLAPPVQHTHATRCMLHCAVQALITQYESGDWDLGVGLGSADCDLKVILSFLQAKRTPGCVLAWSDDSSYDTTFTDEEWEWVTRVLVAGATHWYEMTLRKLLLLERRFAILLQDGSIVVVPGLQGIMLSGSFETFLGNSTAKRLELEACRVYYGIPWGVPGHTAGDDMHGDVPADSLGRELFTDFCARHGRKTNVAVENDGFEFCGYHYGADGFHPVNAPKVIVGAAMAPERLLDAAYRQQVVYALRHATPEDRQWVDPAVDLIFRGYPGEGTGYDDES